MSPTPRVTPRITPTKTTQIKVRKDIYFSLDEHFAAMNNESNNGGFEEIVKTIATNVIDKAMSGIPNQQRVRKYLNVFEQFYT